MDISISPDTPTIIQCIYLMLFAQGTFMFGHITGFIALVLFRLRERNRKRRLIVG